MSLPAPLQTAKQNLWLKYHLKRSSKKPQACDFALTTPVTENSRANPISRAAERPRRASAARSAGRHPARRPAAGTVPDSTGLLVTGAARAAAQAAPRSQDGGTAGERAVRGDPPGRARPRPSLNPRGRGAPPPAHRAPAAVAGLRRERGPRGAARTGRADSLRRPRGSAPLLGAGSHVSRHETRICRLPAAAEGRGGAERLPAPALRTAPHCPARPRRPPGCSRGRKRCRFWCTFHLPGERGNLRCESSLKAFLDARDSEGFSAAYSLAITSLEAVERRKENLGRWFPTPARWVPPRSRRAAMPRCRARVRSKSCPGDSDSIP